ncbi:hypothetical protein Droror1_Dr00027633 [Drosera rotundifolia]
MGRGRPRKVLISVGTQTVEDSVVIRSWNVKIQTDDLAIATPVKLMDVSGKSSSSLSWADIVEGNRSRDGMERGTDLALGSMGDDGSNRSKPNGIQLGFSKACE